MFECRACEPPMYFNTGSDIVAHLLGLHPEYDIVPRVLRPKGPAPRVKTPSTPAPISISNNLSTTPTSTPITTTTTTSASPSPSENTSQTNKSIACSICAARYDTQEDYKEHLTSDFHLSAVDQFLQKNPPAKAAPPITFKNPYLPPSSQPPPSSSSSSPSSPQATDSSQYHCSTCRKIIKNI
eukprot:TRINITY_DN2029_c2_g1_i2.p1 TRINITY_DN2029_c2_g1~~TRINITY_DN2029_c2_g1_i2.p1  ORF type:complete len:183 (-),score=56.52 TRINITY_DN2029_c2_g1_i2:213-761(-)